MGGVNLSCNLHAILQGVCFKNEMAAPNLQVRMVGIIAVNMVNSSVKNIQPALSIILEASPPMS